MAISKDYYSKHKERFEPSFFEVIPLNSPVKDQIAKFLLKIPYGFVIDQLVYKVQNTSDLKLKDKNYDLGNLVNGPSGKELHLVLKAFKMDFIDYL
jgi:hypothetical protein